MLIEIYNATCKVHSIHPTTYRILNDNLSYENQSVRFAYNNTLRSLRDINKLLNAKGLKIDRISLEKQKRRINHIRASQEDKLTVRLYNNDEFPTGLLPRVLSLLDENGIVYEIKDKRIKPPSCPIKFVLREPFPKLRYYQREAVETITKGSGRGIINAVMGSGKTLCICKMIWDLGVKSVVITPSKPITDYMYDTLVEYFGKSKVTRLNTKSTKTKSINVVNIQALIKLKPELFRDVNACFIDEFHRSAASTYQDVNSNHLANCYYRVGCTATPFRNDGADLGLEAVLSEIVYVYTAQQAIKDGFLMQPEFELIENNVCAQQIYRKEYKFGIVHNEDRNGLIKDCACYHKNDHIIILVKEIIHGEKLRDMIPNSEFIQGKEKDKDRQHMFENFREGKLHCLIGVDKILGEGVDLPIANILILANGGRSRVQVTQNLGRILRIHPNKKEAVIYDFLDKGSKYLETHSCLRQEVYKTYE